MIVIGTVRSAAGFDPLPYVIIHDQYGNATQTDDNGFFSIETQDNAVITALYGGYSVEKVVDGTTMDFLMPVAQLDEVTIEAENKNFADTLYLIVLIILVVSLSIKVLKS